MAVEATVVEATVASTEVPWSKAALVTRNLVVRMARPQLMVMARPEVPTVALGTLTVVESTAALKLRLPP